MNEGNWCALQIRRTGVSITTCIKATTGNYQSTRARDALHGLKHTPTGTDVPTKKVQYSEYELLSVNSQLSPFCLTERIDPVMSRGDKRPPTGDDDDDDGDVDHNNAMAVSDGVECRFYCRRKPDHVCDGG